MKPLYVMALVATTLIASTGCTHHRSDAAGANNRARTASTAIAPEWGAKLGGAWSFKVTVGQHVTQGAIHLTAYDDRFLGTLSTDQGGEVLKIRSVQVNDTKLVMTVDSPQGEVVVRAELAANAKAFQGTVTYHNGQVYAISGSRR
ncbi:hypothetical protein [Inhella sp.]|uniref:hypothetical protein n=1 Tax=Inhella sp. TaxID=1921806 RepID=UPI0035AD8B4C